MADTKQEPGQGGAPAQAPPTAQQADGSSLVHVHFGDHAMYSTVSVPAGRKLDPNYLAQIYCQKFKNYGLTVQPSQLMVRTSTPPQGGDAGVPEMAIMTIPGFGLIPWIKQNWDQSHKKQAEMASEIAKLKEDKQKLEEQVRALGKKPVTETGAPAGAPAPTA